jgi:hypothetical protein
VGSGCELVELIGYFGLCISVVFFPDLKWVEPVQWCVYFLLIFWVVVLMLGCDYWVVGSGCL